MSGGSSIPPTAECSRSSTEARARITRSWDPTAAASILAPRNGDYLVVANTHTNEVIKQVGPLKHGVRPFTIDGRQRFAYTTATGFLGFQASSLSSGHLLYTVPIPGFTYDPSKFSPTAPSHGIALSPDSTQVWVVDGPNSYVHEFDVSGLPDQAPKHLADVRLSHPLEGNETPCAYDCARDGWLQESADGKFLFVGDSGDVVRTSTHRIVGSCPPWELALPAGDRLEAGSPGRHDHAQQYRAPLTASIRVFRRLVPSNGGLRHGAAGRQE